MEKQQALWGISVSWVSEVALSGVCQCKNPLRQLGQHLKLFATMLPWREKAFLKKNISIYIIASLHKKISISVQLKRIQFKHSNTNRLLFGALPKEELCVCVFAFVVLYMCVCMWAHDIEAEWVLMTTLMAMKTIFRDCYKKTGCKNYFTRTYLHSNTRCVCICMLIISVIL